jgi:hypothetical protein
MSVSSSSTTTAEKQVDVSCYDFLYMEMVDYIVRTSNSNDQVFQTLEQLGFRVGQRLAERFLPPLFFLNLFNASIIFLFKTKWF